MQLRHVEQMAQLVETLQNIARGQEELRALIRHADNVNVGPEGQN